MFKYSKRTCSSDIRVYPTPFYYTGAVTTEPILNIININNSTIHHNQDSNQIVSNTTHPSDQNTTVSHTIDELQYTLTWQDKSLCTLNENHSSDDDSDIEDLEGDFLEGKT